MIRRLRARTSLETDPVLRANEPGVDIATGEVRVGDGVTRWDDLPATPSVLDGGTP